MRTLSRPTRLLPPLSVLASLQVLALLGGILTLVVAAACTPDYKAPPKEEDSHEVEAKATPTPTASATHDEAPAGDVKAASDDGATGAGTAQAAAQGATEATEPAKEPTTPKEIELARKAAMVEGRDEDVLKYCAMQGLDSGKGDEQAILGCTLSACRLKHTDQARGYAKGLEGALEKQARTICQANGVYL